MPFEQSDDVVSRLSRRPAHVFLIVMLAVFFAESLVMTLLEVLLPQLGPTAATVLDSTLLTLLVAPLLWFVIVRPLRDLAAESRLTADAVISHAADGLVTMREDGTILSANPAAERLFGYSASELRGQNVKLLMGSPESEQHDGYLRHYLETSERRISGANREVVGRAKDGSPVEVELAVSEMVTRGGRVFIGAMWDVAERRREREELRQAKLAAEAASRLKSDFLASMSHEIRTPMNGVIGMTGVLLATELTARQRDYAETIRRSGESLLAVINDILDFSKMESGRVTLETAPFDLCSMVEEVAELVATHAREKRLDLAVRYAVDSPRQVVGDAGRIRQVLINLAANAVKFTSQGYVLLDVSGTTGPDGSGRFCFRVEDSGIGIRADQVAHLFERFTQADASTTRRFGGTGLGLAICKQLVEAMGGSIGAAPRAGGGSEFFFELPLPIGPTPPERSPFPADLRGVRALVVDDHEVNRRVVAEQLSRWNIRADPAESGEQALGMLREGRDAGDPYAVVLLDFLMPDMDGMQVARTIRSDPSLREAIVIVLSSLERRVAEVESEPLFDDWLVKPIRQSRLMDALVSSWHARHGGTRERLPEPDAGGEAAADRTPIASRVLVADDSTVNRRVAALQLQKLGCSVDVAANGLEAVRMVSAFPYDIVFMDCQMPEMDGYEASAEIRRRQAGTSRVRIVALTAHAMAGEREKCLAAGMDDYLSKPIRPSDLEAMLRKWVAPRQRD